MINERMNQPNPTMTHKTPAAHKQGHFFPSPSRDDVVTLETARRYARRVVQVYTSRWLETGEITSPIIYRQRGDDARFSSAPPLDHDEPASPQSSLPIVVPPGVDTLAEPITITSALGDFSSAVPTLLRDIDAEISYPRTREAEASSSHHFMISSYHHAIMPSCHHATMPPCHHDSPTERNAMLIAGGTRRAATPLQLPQKYPEVLAKSAVPQSPVFFRIAWNLTARPVITAIARVPSFHSNSH
ncbi:uncharacterized protein N7459_004040 [Penicillium hispanicum]|uniref:uncharacterized protein n=1 Tax=Penicillium hispanicum TaxID=1080232 RepID=UPI0025400F7E|nr:uncharacterized protein N7459_004040 [Penicillium hispanicum]KAJ5584240.1 hypothetical protein N7459_004040 [Penicillium hispanicum]